MTGTVAFVAASLDIIGGQGVQARTLRDHLVAARADVVFVPINPRFPAPLAWLRQIKGVRTIVNEFVYLPALWRLRSADVVHVFSASYWSFLLGPVPAMVAARLLRKRVILNYHSGEARDHLDNWGLLVHPWLRLAHEIVVPSRYLQDVFARHGYRTRVIPNVIDLTGFPYRERGVRGPRLLSARNLEPHYGVDVILRAFAILKSRYRTATLTIAGDGSQRPALEALARSLNVDGISFIGAQNAAGMATLYAEADVFVNASTVDNQPLSILEAFAAGLPVVTTPTGDIENMVGADARGRIVDANPQAVSAAIAAVVEDASATLHMVRQARRHVEQHTWPYVKQAWNGVYRPCS